MKTHKHSYKSDLQLLKLTTWVLTYCVVGLLAFHAIHTIGQPTRIANNKFLSQKLSLNLSKFTPVRPVAGTDNNFFLSPEDLSNEKVWRAVADIGIPVLRFPGGEGNWYDWKTGAILSAGRATFAFMEKSKPRTVSMDAFMSHARKVGASVSYVLNLMDSPESIRELASHWKQTNAPVHWVELGNEYYHQNFSKEIGGTDGYLKRAKQALLALRSGGFKGTVGIVLAPSDILGQPYFNFERQWNEEIAMANTHDFDAVILHYYPFVESIGFDSAYQKGPAGLLNTIKTLRKQFPGKQVWVTEWNLGPPADIPEINSLEHAIFDLRMLRVLMDSKVDMSCYHVLTGTGWELLGPDRLALEYSKTMTPKMLRRVPYFAFKELLQAQKDSVYLKAESDLNGLEYMAFFHDGEVRVVAWTRDVISTRLDIELPDYTTHFLGGQVLRGQLLDKNGSLLRKGSDSPPWVEKVIPIAIHTPVLSGPGIVLLHFSVVPKRG